MSYIDKPIPKVDAPSLVTGKPVYTGDMVPQNALVVKLLRSPYANAMVEEIKANITRKVPGVVAVYTHEDVPETRFTTAGQSYPEASPYDRLILDKHLRCVGDPVAIVAAETEAAAEKALRLIKVKYKVMEPLLDFTNAKDNPILVHPETSFRALCPVGADNQRNLCAVSTSSWGDFEAEFAASPVRLERTYYTKANNQAMMEPFRTFAYPDEYGRINVVSSTQVPFHVRRILATALELPRNKIRVVKPRIGGGFGAKQSAVSEVFPAFVALKTGRPAYLSFTRQESQTNGSPRHQMRLTVRIGADKDGTLRALGMNTLSNAGAYGDHGPTTVGLTGTKSISLYSGLKAAQFDTEVVYTNTMGAGAYRGYGATQGIFALECAVNELAAQLKLDPTALRQKNMVKQGETMSMYYGETCTSTTLAQCLERAKQMIGWDEKYPLRHLENGKIRALGVSLAMQGSGISGVDVGSAELRLQDDGLYTLLLGCTDMGTGCDTILTQMAAECLECPMQHIAVRGVDTDQSPYDCGSYASSTTYVTGTAVVKACTELRQKITALGAALLGVAEGEASFDGAQVFCAHNNKAISLAEIADASFSGGGTALSAHYSHSSPVSPPPFMAGIAEIELDPQTGAVELVEFAAAIDCGTVINSNLARVQAEGGIVQGLGMALFEDIGYTPEGRMMQNSFLQYKIPSRLDAGRVRVEFVPSYEPTGPFGAKSIGELVINCTAPAVLGAIQNATGLNFYTLPVKAEEIALALAK